MSRQSPDDETARRSWPLWHAVLRCTARTRDVAAHGHVLRGCLSILALAALVLLPLTAPADAQVAPHDGCHKTELVWVKLGKKTLVRIRVCAPPGRGASAPARAEPPAPAGDDRPADRRRRDRGGGRRGDGAGSSRGDRRSARASGVVPIARAPAAKVRDSAAAGAGSRPAPSRVSSGDRADAGRGAGEKSDARDERRDLRADGAVGALPVLPVSSPAAGRGWYVLPIPVLGLILLVAAGAWLVAGRRSERLAYAGAVAQPAGGTATTRAGAPGLAANRGFPLRAIAEVAAIAAVVVAGVVAVQAFVIKPAVIPSESMVPTLVMGQQVMMERVSLRFGEPDRGDLVVFKPPAGAADSQCGVPRGTNEPCSRPTGGRGDDLYIKRVVGQPGDRLKILEGRVYIDGKLQREPQIRASVACKVCNLPQEITIPAGHFFVMGDNRGESIDSRIWGPVAREQIVGRAVFSFWPPRRFGGL